MNNHTDLLIAVLDEDEPQIKQAYECLITHIKSLTTKDTQSIVDITLDVIKFSIETPDGQFTYEPSVTNPIIKNLLRLESALEHNDQQPIQQPHTPPTEPEKEETNTIPEEAAEEVAASTTPTTEKDTPPSGMKTCRICGQQKKKTEFYEYQNSCKECNKKRAQERKQKKQDAPEPLVDQKPEAPQFTEIFMRWLDGNDEFNAKDFLDDNPTITKEDLDKILSHLLTTEKIYQYRHPNIFRVNQ